MQCRYALGKSLILSLEDCELFSGSGGSITIYASVVCVHNLCRAITWQTKDCGASVASSPGTGKNNKKALLLLYNYSTTINNNINDVYVLLIWKKSHQ